MSVVKSFRFPVSVGWEGGRMTTLSSRAKPELEVATPPEFRGGVPGTWTPEDLLVGAVASCYALTLAAVAEWRGVPLLGLDVHADGHVEKRREGYGFATIELVATVETEAGFEDGAERAAAYAEEACIVGKALAFPVQVETTVRVREREMA